MVDLMELIDPDADAVNGELLLKGQWWRLLTCCFVHIGALHLFMNMYFLYSLALSLLFIALLPYFVYQAARHGKYAGSFLERLGRLPESVRGDGRKPIWIHAVSVGEFVAARPLIERLRSELPNKRVVVSTATMTGQQLARSQSHLFDCAFYFPFDWKFSVRRALARVNPSAVIILETEMWPNFLDECRRQGVPVILVNGRISPRSFVRYQRVGSFVRRVLQDFSLMVMQSEADADRARKLGAHPDQLRVCGNLKYELPEVAEMPNGIQDAHRKSIDRCEEIDRQFALSSSHHLIVAGSTAPEEESMVLAALKLVRSRPGLEDTRLIIAPRHPERFDEVAGLLSRSGFTFSRRSQVVKSATEVRGAGAGSFIENQSSQGGRASAPEVILLDSIGELAGIYRFATVVFVGGSLVPRGGHNIIEPAAFAKPIVIGPFTENFRQIVSDFERADAVVQLTGTGPALVIGLDRTLSGLLSDRERARAIGERARNILLANRGATDCTVAALEEFIHR
jgi:3-deoxy-D-manno-octulosonic-acid transferase